MKVSVIFILFASASIKTVRNGRSYVYDRTPSDIDTIGVQFTYHYLLSAFKHSELYKITYKKIIGVYFV